MSRQYPPAKHLLIREPGRLGRTACNASVSGPSQYTDSIDLATCHKCAKNAPGLTVDQRRAIWDQANERLEKFSASPWDSASKQNSKREARTE